MRWKSLAVVFGLCFTTLTWAKFADIDTTHPYFHAIDWLQEKNVLKGYDIDGVKLFRSLQKVSRAEALKILLLSADVELSKQSAGFPDVQTNDWFRPYIATAKKRSIVSGFKDGRFYPHAQVSRAEFLKMASIAFNFPIEEYQSENQEAWYEPYFAFAHRFRIISPLSKDPNEAITRGELAEIIYRLRIVSDKGFRTPYIYSGKGSASFYNEGFAGKATANGEIYDPHDMTAAHRTLPFNTRVRVWTTDPDQSIVVRINDRGPYHSDRILDLSEKAFSKLAPISRGVIEVNFEVFLEPQELPTIPEAVVPEISAEAQNIKVPTSVQSELQSIPQTNINKRTTYLKKDSTPVFKDTVAKLAQDFFPNIYLRKPFPQKILTGTTFPLEGISTEPGYKSVTAFLQPLPEYSSQVPEQLTFTAPVSDRNFVIPMQFFHPGKYQIGLVFDNQRRSRVEEIEVTSNGQNLRRFAITEAEFYPTFDASVIPENQQVKFTWQPLNEAGELAKFTFTAPGAKEPFKTIFVEETNGELLIDYEFFERFIPANYKNTPNVILAVDRYAAESNDRTLNTQTTNWKKVGYHNFRLVPGFSDSESDKISVNNFIRFPEKLQTATLTGKLLTRGIKLPEHAYWTTPDNKIKKIPIVMQGTDQFSLRINPENWGTHILEIVSTEGKILFNRAIYYSEDIILPVQTWARVTVRSNSRVSIKNWVNQWRSRYDLNQVNTDVELAELAQQYADQMATENFIGHTSPTGVTFEDRIKQANLQGEYAENLSFGTTLDLALDGLQDSASHFHQITNAKWRRVGIGLAQNKEGYYVVQIFGQ